MGARVAVAGHALLRVVTGLLFLMHGGMKFFGWFGGMPAGMELTPLVATGGAIELGCGTLVLLGLLARPAAFLASGEMAVAYFLFHFPKAFWPIPNQGEPAVLFCFLFLYFALAGPGPFSLDAAIWKRRARWMVGPPPGDVTDRRAF